MRLGRHAVVAVVAVVALACAGGAGAEESAALPAGSPKVLGHWSGSKLRCQKDEGKLVRCGTPAGFEVTFAGDGTGTTPGEDLPKSFAWRWLGAGEIGLTPVAGGEELKLFGIEGDGEALTFQAYVFLPTADANAPPEARYIHYVFDVNLVP